MQLGHTSDDRLTNLRFADDILLTAPSLNQITRLLADLSRAASQHGLHIHPTKTKVLTNISLRRGRERTNNIEVAGMNIEILNYTDHTKYLGRKLTFDDPQATESQHRIAAAWAKFNSLRHELTSKAYPLKSRLRLFNTTVTATALYGSASWTLTVQLEEQLQRTQRRMLRLVVGTGRRRTTNPRKDPSSTPTFNETQPTSQPQPKPSPTQQQITKPTPNDETDDDDNEIQSNPTDPEHNPDDDGESESELEPWEDFVRRATHVAEQTIQKLNIDSWAEAYWKRK
jgi:hypothetical protein